jgi:amino acid adenylation domain-containing protein
MIQPVYLDQTKINLTEAERHQLLFQWNDTQAEYPKDTCIHQLFDAQVERTPGAVAVVFEGQQLTYQELNCRANQLAHYLQKLGVGPEVLVGICMERSLDLIVGLLGILKAGGAYVPLDPTYPLERLAFMLEDAQVPVLLTQEQLLDKLPTSWAQVICLDADWQLIEQENEENSDSYTTGDNLAYVIYTSGSTGQPKGVEIQHSGLVNLVTWHQGTYNVEPTDRATQLASSAFDASVWEIWPYLTAGASLYIPNEETRTSLTELLNWLTTKAITICFLPTPLAEVLVDSQLPSGLQLRFLLTGGDKLHQVPQKPLPFCLVNHYGPTENTVVTTWAEVAHQAQKTTPPSIGRPIANTQVYILDSNLQPVRVGESGELYISGVGLARGYRNQPELTAEKFISNPFENSIFDRLYKTGDLVRYLSDGNIEFLGRIDYQVKIRGFRIELGDIEAALVQHPAVKQNVVLAREDIPGDRRLVAYVNLYQEQTVGNKDLRSFLQSRLPDYMVPSTFVVLDALPLTPNGKVDRQALPAPDYNKTEREESFVAPRTHTEQLIVDTWAEVLGLERIGINDNFFELGGHSLLATQVLSRLDKAFGVELSLRTLFEAPTVTDLSDRIETVRWAVQSLQADTMGNYEEGEL